VHGPFLSLFPHTPIPISPVLLHLSFFFLLLISEQDYNLWLYNEPSDLLSLSGGAASCMLINYEILHLDSISIVF